MDKNRVVNQIQDVVKMITKELNLLIEQLVTKFDEISEERKSALMGLVDFIQNKRNNNEITDLIFICTHNSRRSHLAQIWAQTAASFYNIPNVFCYSGGTETTALYPSVTQTLLSSGFKIQQLSKNENSVYSFKFDENQPSIICFSKRYSDIFNPQSNFAAVMTCTHAEENCPFIPNATKRISLPYNDPKEFDGTPLQKAKYEERSLEIGIEMLYVFSKLKTG